MKRVQPGTGNLNLNPRALTGPLQLPGAAQAQAPAAPAMPAAGLKLGPTGNTGALAQSRMQAGMMAARGRTAFRAPFMGNPNFGGMFMRPEAAFAPFAQPMREEVIEGILAQFQRDSEDVYARLDQKTQDIAISLAKQGKWDLVDSTWTTLPGELAEFMGKGGDPTIAEALLDQINNPDEQIDQCRENSCSAATLQKSLADKNPAQYARMAMDLLSNGTTDLPNGQKLELSAANRQWIEAQNFSPKDKLNAVFQAALMDYGNGADTYDIASDKSSDGEITYDGLNIEEARSLNEALGVAPTIDPDQLMAGLDAKGMKDPNAPDAGEEVFGLVSREFERARGARAQGVFVTLTDGQGEGSKNHMVMIKDIDGDGNVTAMDAKGKPMKIAKKDFGKHVSVHGNKGKKGGIGTGTMTTGTTWITRR